MSGHYSSKLPDDALTGAEYWTRHREALTNPRHPEHALHSAGYGQACKLDATEQGLDADAPLIGGGIAQINPFVRK